MTEYSSHTDKRLGSTDRKTRRQEVESNGYSDRAESSDRDDEPAGAKNGPRPRVDGSPDGRNPDLPTIRPEDDDEEPPGLKEHGYPRRSEWAPDCQRCGGPVIGIIIAGPADSQITPCGYPVAPASVYLL
ncbi:hypothetical protein [Halovivax gelatinilyticus]|uniref:hypothetical protein n=1 Tax=Halovivax gelatinilyticus TaxID=2961597 RepID=UPI0020CA3862|nr:hypothetical protein [Halovivax gelatinilyticus]